MDKTKGANKPLALKLRAKQLVLNGKTQKEAAMAVGVTEKTMGAWCKANGWKAAAKACLAADSGANSLLGFMVYVSHEHPFYYSVVEELHNAYHNHLNNKLTADARK